MCDHLELYNGVVILVFLFNILKKTFNHFIVHYNLNQPINCPLHKNITIYNHIDHVMTIQ